MVLLGGAARCDEPRHRSPRDPDPIQLPDVSGGRRSTCRRWLGVRHRRPPRDAQCEAPWPHPTAGTTYYWSLAMVFASMSVLSVMQWPDDAQLFFLGVLSFTAATVGRAARRVRWRGWLTHHIIGMSLSYFLLLTAFYVDNGANLPFWQNLPSLAYWVAPSLIGLPILIRVLLRHPLVLQQRRANS